MGNPRTNGQLKREETENALMTIIEWLADQNEEKFRPRTLEGIYFKDLKGRSHLISWARFSVENLELLHKRLTSELRDEQTTGEDRFTFGTIRNSHEDVLGLAFARPSIAREYGANSKLLDHMIAAEGNVTLKASCSKET
ncbi:MAG TPA: hypothetical protein VMR81_05860 [Patescibacteria group bacterium]|nr:hypothetical protein [Patescibacteria group bacterium]